MTDAADRTSDGFEGERAIPAWGDDNRCFACSTVNERGLHLRFVQVAEHTAECRWTAPEHVCGSPGIIHGGIQATLLDETIGYACRLYVGEDRAIVTAEFSLRYRRPAPTGVPLVARATVTSAALPDVLFEAAIVLPDTDAPGGEQVLTTATARWKDLGPLDTMR